MQNKSPTKKGGLRIGIDGRVMQEKQPSGIPLYTINTIQEILKLDKDNKYIIFYNSFHNIKDKIPIFEGNVENRIYRIPNKILEWFWRIVPYPKIDKLLRVKIFFSPHFLNIPISRSAKRVITIHDLSFLRNKKFFSKRKNFWHWQNNPKSICKKSHKIIADSQSTKHDIVEFYKIDPKKIRVIYHGVSKKDIQQTEKAKAKILKKFNLEKNGYILFLSTLEPRKNIEGIIDSFFLVQNKMQNYKLVIAGRKGWLFNKIFMKTKKYSLEKKIIFTGFINEEEKQTLLENAHIFIFPSFCEGFGLPLLEAKNSNIPIITSAVSSMPEVAKDSAIIINPHCISDLSEGLLSIMGNKNLRNVLLNKARNLPVLSWEKTAQETLKYLVS